MPSKIHMYGWLGTRTCMSNVKISLYTTYNTLFSVSEHIYTVRATSMHRGNMILVFIEGDQSGNQQAQMSNLNMSLFVLSFLHG